MGPRGPIFWADPHGVENPQKNSNSNLEVEFWSYRKFFILKMILLTKIQKKIFFENFFSDFLTSKRQNTEKSRKMTSSFAKKPPISKHHYKIGWSKKKKNLDFEVLHQKCVENPGGHGGALRILIRAVFEKLEQFSWTSLFFLYCKMNRIWKRTIQRLVCISKLCIPRHFRGKNVDPSISKSART